MDYGEMAKQSVEFLKPLFAAAGGNMVKDGLEAARQKLYEWLKSRFTRPAQSGALQEAVEEPEKDVNWEALLVQVRKALEDDNSFADDLQKLLPEEARRGREVVQQQNLSGGAKGIQNVGEGNTITIN